MPSPTEPVIDVSEQASALTAGFPDARASKEHTTRLAAGTNYAVMLLDPPREIPAPQYRDLEVGIQAYLRVCATLARILTAKSDDATTAVVQAYMAKTLAPFEHPKIRALREASPVGTLLGALLGSDTWIPRDGAVGAQSCEVNLGPATGGILELVEAVAKTAEGRAPLGTAAMEAHIVSALDGYYSEVCRALGKNPVPLAHRQIVVVENDGYYAASFILVQAFRELSGANAVVLPREALLPDTETGRLYFVEPDGARRYVDQVVCDFYLESDAKGAIVEALTKGNVVGASSPVVDVLLGAKWTLGLIMLALEKQRLAEYLSISHEDREALARAFPPTHQHSALFFSRLGINGFNLEAAMADDGGALRSYFAKYSGSGTYGGYDVYNPVDPKEREEFLEDLRKKVLHMLVASTAYVGRAYADSPAGLLIKAFSEATAARVFAAYPQGTNAPKNAREQVLKLFQLARQHFQFAIGSQVASGLEEEILSQAPKGNTLVAEGVRAIADLSVQIRGGGLVEEKVFRKAFEAFSRAVLVSNGSEVKANYHTQLASRLLMEIATSSYMPFVYQGRIPVENMQETRVVGVMLADAPAYLAVEGRGYREAKRTLFSLFPPGARLTTGA